MEDRFDFLLRGAARVGQAAGIVHGVSGQRRDVIGLGAKLGQAARNADCLRQGTDCHECGFGTLRGVTGSFSSRREKSIAHMVDVELRIVFDATIVVTFSRICRPGALPYTASRRRSSSLTRTRAVKTPSSK